MEVSISEVNTMNSSRHLRFLGLVLVLFLVTTSAGRAEEGGASTAASAPATLTPQQEIDQQSPAALEILKKWQNDHPERAKRTLHIIYWTPADRDPQPRYRERLTAIMLDIQNFYRTEMKRNGFGPLSINLDIGQDKLLNLHVVKGKEPYAHYGNPSGSEIRKECLPVLKAAGIDADKETILIFCNMSNYDEKAGTVNQNSPYYAGGSKRSGTGWQVDSEILDLDLLSKKEPLVRDGQYGKISVGKYNSIFIGGVCHELGHDITLPHNKARPDQTTAWGTSLMGDGNRTYGDDRRGEGRGTFLILADAMRLASHPMFCGSVKGIDIDRPKVTIERLDIVKQDNAFVFKGKVTAKDVPVYAIVGYMDPDGGGDYDSSTCTAVPDADGNFTLNCNALKTGASELRIVGLTCNGTSINDRHYRMNYIVGADGKVELDTPSTEKQKEKPNRRQPTTKGK